MRWGDERYVRVYTRDTIDWQALSFEAQGLMTLILRKVDRAGLATLGKHGKRGVAMLVCHPTRWDSIAPALEELLSDGCVRIEGDKLIVPNYIEAQEAPQTDAQRKRSQRERDRDLAAAGVTKPSEESRIVTKCHEPVTSGHEESQEVTPCRSVPSVPSDPDPPSAGARVAPDVPEPGPIRPTTAHNLLHCLRVAVETRRPELGLYTAGQFADRDADALIRETNGATDEIARRIALFVADDRMAPWTVAKMRREWNGIGVEREPPASRFKRGSGSVAKEW